jgi:hypothetical protein
VNEIKDVLELLRGDGAVITMFVIFVAGLTREWWVMGVSYRAAVAERDRAIATERAWRDAALRERHVSERALDAAG